LRSRKGIKGESMGYETGCVHRVEDTIKDINNYYYTEGRRPMTKLQMFDAIKTMKVKAMKSKDKSVRERAVRIYDKVLHLFCCGK